MAPKGTGALPVLVGGWTLIAVAAVVIAARIYLRLKIQGRPLMISDYLIIASWISGCATTSICIALKILHALDPEVGTDFSHFDGNHQDIKKILSLFWFNLIPFHFSIFLSKAALLSMYMQIFMSLMKKRLMILWATIAYLSIAFVICMIMPYSICHPIDTIWDPFPTACSDAVGEIILKVTWGLNALGNLLIFAIPWLILPELKIEPTLKFGIYCTFLLDIIMISFTIVRLVMLVEKEVGNSVPMSTIVLWTTLECDLGIVVAALPSLAPYFLAAARRKSTQNSASMQKRASGNQRLLDTA